MNTSFRQPRTLSLFSRVRGYFIASVALFLFAAVAVSSVYAAGTVTGTVFQDFNGNGTFNTTVATGVARDLHLAGVTVTAFDAAGAIQATTTTVRCTAASTPSAFCTGADTGPNYSLGPISGTGPYRIEFTWDNTTGSLLDFEPSARTADSVDGATTTTAGSTVQFVQDGSTSNVNLALNRPCDYCQSNARLITDRYENGSGVSSTNASVVSMNYDPSSHTSDAQFQQVGSVWAIAYNGLTKRAFLGAFLKRHVGVGPRGLDGVYAMDYSGSPSVLGGFDLQGVTASNGGSTIDLGSVTRSGGSDYTLPTSTNTANVDLDAFAKVGTVGYGGMDFASDGKTLWMVNLNQRTLIAVDTSQVTISGTNPNNAPTAAVRHYNIVSGGPSTDTLTGAPSCTNGTLRPFGLKIRDTYGYVGVVCDAASSATLENPPELIGYVLQFDLANPTAFTTLVTIPFTYNREPYYKKHDNTGERDGQWQRWMNTWSDADIDTNNISSSTCCNDFRSSPSPILSDIEFMPDGSMVLGVMDRFGHQSGWDNNKAISGDTSTLNYGNVGDILLARYNAGTFTLEQGENDTKSTPAGFRTDDSPGNNGEFFVGDYYDGSDAAHHETALGGLALLSGTNEAVSTAFDPSAFNSQGLFRISTATGLRTDSYNVTTATGRASFGKASGMGDMELLCDIAPIELGNRVWDDANNNGIQDPGELPIAGVTVRLFRGNTVVGTAVTDANGEYYFVSSPSATDSNTADNVGQVNDSGAGIQYDTAYEIRIEPGQGSNSSILAAYFLTIQNDPDTGAGDGGANATSRDSDASDSSGTYVVALTTGNAGNNNHTFDIGFYSEPVPPSTILGAIGNYVWLDEDSDGYQDEGEPGIPNVTVQLKNGNGAVIATRITDSNGGYLFTELPAGTYYVQVSNSIALSGLTQTTIYPHDGADLYNQNQSVGNGYQINLGAGEVNLTADFGYNWNPTNDVNTGGPANTVAALGDRVWIDSDGDGAQDDSEIGVSGVEVTIYGSPGPDEAWGTNDDVPYTDGGYTPTRTTDSNGLYMFDGLPPGQYLVRVTDSSTASHDVLGTQYTQTGDPDHFGTTGTSNDNQTTIPVLLGPGDVFLNADFGYQPGGNGGSPELGSIGNFVWYDRNADGVGPTAGGEAQGAAPGNDNTEFGIGGVTVALIRDLNGNGEWDAGEPIIATTHTSDGTEDVDNDGNVDYLGYYNFRDLPVTDGVGTDDYIVWVNDTNNVLNGLRATYDQNGAALPAAGLVTGLGISSVADLTTTPVIDQDFGYTDKEVLDTPTNNGVLGDRVWLDNNGDGVQDAGEQGIPGVTVELYDSTGTTLIATTTTGFDGYYLFPNLETSAGGIEYVVRVDPTTLPGNLTQTYDYNGTGTPNESSRTLTDAEPIQLDQDFGYRGLGTIGNLVWNDINADGDQDAGELGIPGVTLDLYFDTNKNGLIDPGEPKLATQTTDANGGYLFTGLATETGTTGTAGYIVDVSDNAGVLTGYWHSLGANPGDTTDTTGNESPAISHYDPVAVLLTNAVPNNRNADFGYYVLPGAVGNYVWYDTNADGVQDASEVGINGTTVTLEIRYPGQDGQLNTPDDTITTITTKTMTEPGGTRAGWYSFANLLQDEDYNGLGTYGTEPEHTITVTLPVNYSSSPTGNGTPTTDSNDPTGTGAQPYKGQTNTLFANDSASISSYDFGVYKLELTGTVFLDIFNGTYNGNLDDPSETPSGGAQSGLIVSLYADDNDDGVPDGPAVANTVTNTTGDYAFTGLEPGRYIVSVILPPTWRSTIDTYAPTDTNDPQEGVNNNDNGIGGVAGQVFSKTFNLIAGSTGANNVVTNTTATTSNDRIDFGMIQSPTAAPELAAVSAQAADASSIRIKWKTLNERLVSGFNVQRSDSEQGSYINLNPELVSAKSSGSDLGKSYKFVDSTITAGATYWYRIELVRSDGTTAYSDAVQVTVSTEACSAAPDKVEVVGPLKDAVVKAGKVKFKWKASNCAVTYEFRLRETNKKGTIVIRKDGLTKPKTTFKKLEAGKSYVWRVSACGANGQCTFTKWRAFRVE